MEPTSINRRQFLAAAAGCITTASLRSFAAEETPRPSRPNILLITADDMNWDAPGCFGGKTPDITPNIDRLASESVRFEYAHVTIAVCMPSREALMTGRYPHRSGGMGFEPIREDVPTLQERLRDAGCLNGILSKTEHLKPDSKFPWDMRKDAGQLGLGRDPQLYYQNTKDFIERAGREGKPFFLMANSNDPHRPFSGSQQEWKKWSKKDADGNCALDRVARPSRIYKPDEIEVPGFLADLPDVRKEVSEYYASVRRCDDTVGAVLRALKESGQEENTLVMFLSDNGMAFPFSKTNCYLHSTRTPWMVRWPGHTKPGSVDRKHFISGIDFLPTVLEAAGLKPMDGVDGRSFVPLLEGGTQKGRERVFTVFHKTVADTPYPMRCVQDRKFGYIFNSWSDGATRFRNESQSGLTMKAMEAAAESDERVAERVKMFLYRVPDELYDFENDPDALHNLVDDPSHKLRLEDMRNLLLDWMKQTQDPLLNDYSSHLKSTRVQ